MKKIFSLLCLLLSGLVLFCQPQRLALLPSAMKVIGGTGERYVPSLCIDFFREAPGLGGKAANYSTVESIEGSSILKGHQVNAKDLHHVEITQAEKNCFC